MKKLFLISLLIICFGCITEKKRLEICQSCPVKTITKDSIVIKIEEKLKEVTIRDTVTITKILPNPCAELCDQAGNLKAGFKKTLTSDKGTKSELSVKDGSLVISDNLNGLKTKGIVKDTSITNKSFVSEQVPARCEKTHKTSFDGFTNWWFYISAGLGVIFLGFKFLRFKKII